jgi:hypothetical protein
MSLEVTGSIETATTHPALAITVEISRQQATPGGVAQVYVGSFMRFTALSGGRHGGFVEVFGFDNQWHTFDTWEET